MAFKKKKIAVIIPAKNEERHIRDTLLGIPQHVDYIIVINDGSTDNTSYEIKKIADIDKRIIVIEHLNSKGVGGAMKSGLKEGIKTDADVFVKLDADNQMDIQALNRLLLPIVDDSADFVKGTRFTKGGKRVNMPLIRVIGTIILTFLMRLATGYWNITDPQNGFIALSRTTVETLDINRLHSSFTFENSLLINIAWNQLRITEVGVTILYSNESSHLRISRFLIDALPYLIISFIKRIVREAVFDIPSPIPIFYLASLAYLSLSLLFFLISLFGIQAPFSIIFLENNSDQIQLVKSIALQLIIFYMISYWEKLEYYIKAK